MVRSFQMVVRTEARLRLDRDKLLRARELLGYGIETTAQEAGVSKNSVLRAEHEEDIRPVTARKIAGALGVRVADLLEEKIRPKGGSPLSAERALEVADPDVFRRVVEETPTAELKQAALGLADLTRVPTRQDLNDDKEAHLRVVANHRIGVINVVLDSRGVRSPVELVARRFNDAMTPPDGLQDAREKAG